MKTTETITYAELAERMDALKLFNKAPELDENIYDGLENGNLMIQNDDGTDSEDYVDIQWYLISPRDAEYLKSYTDELVFYSEVLDEYVWGVTHFSWEDVKLEVKK